MSPTWKKSLPLHCFAVIGLALGIIGFNPALAKAEDTNTTARTLVHLLDYIAQDYSGAVSKGQIISASEYAEMQEFSRTALETYGQLHFTGVDNKQLSENEEKLKQINQAVADKKDGDVIAALAREVKKNVIALAGLQTVPNGWPVLARGRPLFEQNCAPCHGNNGMGDGPAAATLNPKPTSFHNAERMDELAPFQAFNTIRLGVTGTAMAGFSTLSDQEVWDLAFYVVSIRHEAAARALDESARGDAVRQASAVGLAAAANQSDAELERAFTGADAARKRALDVLRTLAFLSDRETLALAKTRIDQAVEDYGAGNNTSAREKALSAYLEGIEPIEPRLNATNPELKQELERAMFSFRKAIESKEPKDRIVAMAKDIQGLLLRTGSLLEDSKLSPSLVFVMSGAVILREGFEAVLVLIAILGLIRRMNIKRAARWVHLGWSSALLLGVVLWLCSEHILTISSAHRELMEGVVSLLAVTFLLYIGFWLHSKTEIHRWKEFVDGQVKALLKTGNLVGLMSIAFVAVFREAFETVLFLSTIRLEGGPETSVALLGGVSFAFILVVALAWAFLRFSSKVPIRTLFGVSSLLMGILAVIMTGKGMHALQETGILSITFSKIRIHSDLLGLYPTLETVAAQVLILAIVIGLWNLGKRPAQAAG